MTPSDASTFCCRSPDSEIVKLRGFYSPQFFVPILAATIDDPSPANYPAPGGNRQARKL